MLVKPVLFVLLVTLLFWRIADSVCFAFHRSGEASWRDAYFFVSLILRIQTLQMDDVGGFGFQNEEVPDSDGDADDLGGGALDQNELPSGEVAGGNSSSREEGSQSQPPCSSSLNTGLQCDASGSEWVPAPEPRVSGVEEVQHDIHRSEGSPEASPPGLDDNGNPVSAGSLSQSEDVSDAPRQHTAEYYNSLGAKPKRSDYLSDLKRKRRWLYESLVDYPASPEKLHQLLRSGVSANMEFTEECLDTNHKIFEGYSPIHFACTEGSAQLLGDLIQYKADVNKIGKNGESALYYACVGCKISHARMLLRHNADINVTHADIGGETPLLATVASYSADHSKAEEYLEIARILILAGAGVNQSDYMDVSPLYVAVTKKDTRMTQLLINSGATLLVSGNNEYATKLLMRAIDHESEANVRLLISYGCDVNGVSQSHGLRHTPLDLAVVKNNLGIILDLLNAGAGEDLNEPLHSAARNKHLVTLLLLIAQGGDVNARNNVDKATLMLTLTRARSVVGVDMLMRLAANPNYENTLGSTPVWAAVRANYPELVKRFIYCNCCLDTPSIQHFLYRPITALQLALELKFFDMARWLLYAGCLMRPRWIQENQMPIGLRDEPQMLTWLEKWTYTPRSLRFLCRTVVRRKTGLKLSLMLKSILYPDSLKDYIRLADLEREMERL